MNRTSSASKGGLGDGEVTMFKSRYHWYKFNVLVLVSAVECDACLVRSVV
jgi:hypothetical protein